MIYIKSSDSSLSLTYGKFKHAVIWSIDRSWNSWSTSTNDRRHTTPVPHVRERGANFFARRLSQLSDRHSVPSRIMIVLIAVLSYGARNVLSYTRHMMQNFLAFRDSPIIPLRRSPEDSCGWSKLLRPGLGRFTDTFCLSPIEEWNNSDGPHGEKSAWLMAPKLRHVESLRSTEHRRWITKFKECYLIRPEMIDLILGSSHCLRVMTFPVKGTACDRPNEVMVVNVNKFNRWCPFAACCH